MSVCYGANSASSADARSWPSGAGGHDVGKVGSDADQLARLVPPDENIWTKPLSIRQKDKLITFTVTAKWNCG